MSLRYRRILPDPEYTYSFQSLRSFYTQALFTAAKGTADKTAAEMEKWMKDNAPWRDRPAMFIPSQMGGWIKKPAANARKHLRAYAQWSAQQDWKVYQAAVRDAKKENAKYLKDVNKQRAKGNLIPLARLPDEYSVFIPKPASTVKGPTITILAEHGRRADVPYAVWLEIANGGRFSILGPAIEKFAPKFMRATQMLVNSGKIQGRSGASFLPEVLRPEIIREDLEVQATNVITPGIRRPKAVMRRQRKLPNMGRIK